MVRFPIKLENVFLHPKYEEYLNSWDHSSKEEFDGFRTGYDYALAVFELVEEDGELVAKTDKFSLID